jgi:hypothetical protein
MISLLRVHENLFGFLELHAQHRDDHYYWIDQICIHHTDTDERNHQVSMMIAAIYQGAEEVVVWLGTANGASRLTKILSELSQEIDGSPRSPPGPF